MSGSARELCEERSLAMHAAIAARFADNPAILDRACARVRDWLSGDKKTSPYANAWSKILLGTPREIAAFLATRGEFETTMRSCSPFAGVLTATERWAIYREVKARLEAAR